MSLRALVHGKVDAQASPWQKTQHNDFAEALRLAVGVMAAQPGGPPTSQSSSPLDMTVHLLLQI
jgi:hypothetical protein